MTLSANNPSLEQTRKKVAGILLDHSRISSKERPGLTHRDIATKLGTGWDTVYLSFRSLQKDGAIRIEHNRIVINQKLCQKLAEEANNAVI